MHSPSKNHLKLLALSALATSAFPLGCAPRKKAPLDVNLGNVFKYSDSFKNDHYITATALEAFAPSKHVKTSGFIRYVDTVGDSGGIDIYRISPTPEATSPSMLVLVFRCHLKQQDYAFVSLAPSNGQFRKEKVTIAGEMGVGPFNPQTDLSKHYTKNDTYYLNTQPELVFEDKTLK